MKRLFPIHPKTARLSTSRGQALTEFLALALVLVPLFLLIPLIAKYQDISHQVQMASRYVAFDAMTRNGAQSSWKTPGQLAGEVRRRFFSNADAPIKTDDVAGDFVGHQNLFWRGPAAIALIAHFDSDVAVSFGPNQAATQAGALSTAGDGLPFNAVPGVADDMGLAAKGIYTANVTVKLANMPAGLKAYAPFDNINLSMSRHTSVVDDAWQAKNPDQVQSRIDSRVLVPGTSLGELSPAVDAAVRLVEAGQVDGPKLGKLDFWQDVVPPDRLK